MPLNAFVAENRKQILGRLSRGEAPQVGEFDGETLRQALLKGGPQVGATRYEPNAVNFEFAFPDPIGAAMILRVRVPAPERIVFMPVPGWVIENIWQGDVDGSYHFEKDADELLAKFTADLEESPNLEWFGPRPPKRRE